MPSPDEPRRRRGMIVTDDPERRRGIIVTALVLAALAIGFYIAFVIVTVAH